MQKWNTRTNHELCNFSISQRSILKSIMQKGNTRTNHEHIYTLKCSPNVLQLLREKNYTILIKT